jgi:CubicO group peptidase (beta-lactamase class C family)
MMRTVRFVVTFVFVLCSAVHIVAQTKPSADSSQKASDQEGRIHRVEATLVDFPMGEGQTPLRMDLLELMKTYNVPGLSVAVIDDYKIAWAKGFGVIETGSSTPVTPKTLFQAGSISKPVAATGALYLAEHGKLALDENVNEKLKTWKVPDNDFTKNEKVTLRRLMSHTAGLTVHGFPGYDVNEAMPTLVQIFNGEKPANTAPIRVDTVPGTIERYSGGGVTIEQQLMVDVSGKAFPALMRELVLDKIGMAESSYEQPLPPARAAMTASGTYSDGKVVQGRWHIYPEMAAAGLWTTPTDLSKFAIEIAQSKQGKANRVLSEKMTREMLTPVLEAAGLGLFMEKGNPGQFGHNGADEGFQAILTMNAETGKGVAIMANSDNGITVGDMLVRKIAKEYGWNYKFSDQPGMEAGHMLVLVAKVKNVQAALQRYAELKKTPTGEYTITEQTLNTVGYVLLYSGHEQDAISVFQRNVEDYPQSGNVYDSLGEAYMKIGQKELAIQNYEKSLQLDPKNKNAVEMLKKLREMK